MDVQHPFGDTRMKAPSHPWESLGSPLCHGQSLAPNIVPMTWQAPEAAKIVAWWSNVGKVNQISIQRGPGLECLLPEKGPQNEA
jgi:hypothetical protein